MSSTTRRRGAAARTAVTGSTALLGLSLGIGLLAGCAGQEAGAAAVVGDRRISVAEVQSAYTDVVPLVGPDAQFTQATILNWLILEPYLVEVAAREGNAVSATEARAEFAKVEGAPKSPSAGGVAVVRAILARGAVTTDKDTAQLTALVEELSGRLQAAHVEINPRYGAGLDPETASIVDAPANWLVQPSAAPSDPAAQPTQ